MTLAVACIHAQAPPAFDAASVKINKSGDVRTGGQLDGTRFSMINETLWRIIGEAYANPFALPRFLIVGGPDWIDSARFDITAVATTPLDPRRAQLMLRSLLAERFKLVAHDETRQRPMYALLRARRDRELGPQLHRSSIDCAELTRSGQRPKSLQPGQPPPCIMRFGPGFLGSNGMTMTQLAEMGLSRAVNDVVVDRTGLDGGFEWTLQWAPNQGLSPAGVPAPTSDDRTSIFTAIQEQLGLKLERITGPVEVLVIDHVESPTPD